jgi:sugar O-acyltransferase (sialic acid O-acetyltransferase NeuD family)
MISSLIILGTGGNCIDIQEAVNLINEKGPKQYNIKGFLDDDQTKWNSIISGCHVLGPLSSALNYEKCLFINGIGSPLSFAEKASVIKKTKVPDEKFARIIHPDSWVSPSARIGNGTVILSRVSISSNVKTGRHVMILPGVNIGHDSVIEDFSTIASGVTICGSVVIEKGCYIGANASIRGNIQIGKGALVGMGAVVIKDVPAGETVAGNPARALTVNKKFK